MQKRKVILVLVFLMVLSSFSAGAAELSLEEAVEILVEDNRELKNARKDIESAEKDIELAERSYFPTVELQSSYTRRGDDSDSSNENNGSSGLSDLDSGDLQLLNLIEQSFESPDENYSTSLSISQPLWRGGRAGIQNEIAAYGVEIARADYEKIVEEQIFNLIQSYYGVLQAEAMVEIREEALTTVKEHLRVVENNLEAGTAIRQDLLQSQIEQRRAEEELTAAENDLKIARRRLAQLLVSDQQYSVRDPEPDFDFSLERNKLYDLAVENNSELLVLELNRKITELNKKLDGEYYRPNVNLNGSYNWEGEEFLGDESWSLTAAVTVPLYDGGSGKIKAEQIDKELEKLENSRQNMLENIDIELEDVLLTVEENKEKIDLEKLSLENAEENLEIANNSYESGVAANTEVIDAQATYNQARIALMQAEYNYEIELFRTLFESGQLREYFEDVVEDEN